MSHKLFGSHLHALETLIKSVHHVTAYRTLHRARQTSLEPFSGLKPADPTLVSFGVELPQYRANVMLVLVPQRTNGKLPGVYLYLPSQRSVKARKILTANAKGSAASRPSEWIISKFYDRLDDPYVFSAYKIHQILYVFVLRHRVFGLEHKRARRVVWVDPRTQGAQRFRQPRSAYAFHFLRLRFA